MENYLIYTDSAADLPAHIYQEYDLRIIPMEYVINGETHTFYTNSPDHDKICDELFAAQKNNADVHTSQITPFNYIEAWTDVLKEGNDILYLCFSSGMSATYDNAVSASYQLLEEFPDRKLVVVDSLSATQGQGVLATAALMNRAKGMTIEENAAWLKEKIPYMCHRFMVGDLNYLHKGGRVSKTSAVVGSMLNIKPILIIGDDGKLEVVAKVRGEKVAIKRLINGYVNQMGVPDVPKIIYVGHTSRYEEAEEIKKQLEAVVEPGTVIETTNLSPIIGSHVGPSFFSVCGWGFKRKE
jgi:DegV family protein with EDD domain